MPLTYTRARERTTLKTGAAARMRVGHAVLTVTALVSAVALLFCYAGRMRAFSISSSPAADVVNLAADPTDDQLAAVTQLAFANPADARFATRQLASAIGAAGDLPNVGALARLEVPLTTVERSRGLVEYAERARSVRARAPGPSSPSTATAG